MQGSVSSPYSQELTVGAVEHIDSTSPDDSEMQLLWIVAPICAAVVILLLIVLAVVFVRYAVTFHACTNIWVYIYFYIYIFPIIFSDFFVLRLFGTVLS